MDKNIKTAILILAAYLLVFFIGFKSGAAYLRMQNKVKTEKVEIPINPISPAPQTYYIIEKRDYGTYTGTTISTSDNNPIIMKIFTNEKLRPLLKSLDIEIYNENGEKIY